MSFSSSEKALGMGSLDQVMERYRQALSMDVDRDRLLGMMPGMLKMLARLPDRREPVFRMDDLP
jgi:hypothetical protein